VLNLKELVLVDGDAVQFLAGCEAAGMTLRDCPGYVRRWIDREKGRAKEGNVRELANFVERAVILRRGEELEVPVAELRSSSEMTFVPASTSSFRQAECSVIIKALKAASGRIAGKGGAAEQLGVKPTTLQNKIRRLRHHKSTISEPAND
jgi:transcriptional regulator with AAA-type ATPase domain